MSPIPARLVPCPCRRPNRDSRRQVRRDIERSTVYRLFFCKRRKGNRFRARLIAVSSFIGFRTALRVTLHDGTSFGTFRISLNVFRFSLYREHQQRRSYIFCFFIRSFLTNIRGHNAVNKQKRKCKKR